MQYAAANSRVQVHILENNIGRLATQFLSHPLDRGSGVLGDQGAGAGRAGEGNHVDARIILEGEITKLPDGCRTVFVLYTIDGFKHREIAEMLDISEGTSKSQLSLAKERLREQLLPYMEVLKNEL